MNEEDIGAIVDLAVARGTVVNQIIGGPQLVLEAVQKEEAETEATTIALAVMNSRKTIADLIDETDPFTSRGDLYRTEYGIAVKGAGLEGVELMDRFPVLTGNFGYTRGSSQSGTSCLIPFRNSKNGNLVVYADAAETEALFLRLDPVQVLGWLRRHHPQLPNVAEAQRARLAILEHCNAPTSTDDPVPVTPGVDLLKLLHSFSHRFIRRAATFSGIDRNALSELIVPLHLGFFVFAAARGDFVLGGLQAVFETELHNLLDDVVNGDHRCPLDPGCRKSGGACMACLHLGEPSCRYFNRFLDRTALLGPTGYIPNLH